MKAILKPLKGKYYGTEIQINFEDGGEHPILFSTPMVKAILDGRKTQTRRIVKGVALDWLAPDMFTPEFVASQENNLCPYGKIGDILWVRETHAIEESPNEYRFVIYKATDPEYPGKWRPSIFLKRAWVALEKAPAPAQFDGSNMNANVSSIYGV